MKKKVLAIGGAGYIGTRFCDEFHNKFDITVVDILWFGNYLNKNIKFHKIDAFKLDLNFIDQNKFENVIIISGLSNDPMANLSPSLNYKHNLYLNSFLLDMISNSKYIKKVIFGSSCSVYGNTNNKILSEKGEIKVEFPYGITKYLTDCHIELIAKNKRKIKFISLRQGTVSGFSNKMRFDLVINKMVLDAIFKNKITLFDFKAFRPILDIRDAVSVYAKIINNNQINSGVYNLHSYNINILDLAKKVQTKVSQKYEKKIEIVSLNKKEKRNYKVSNKKLNNFIKHNYNKVNDTIDDIMNNIDKLKNPMDSKFINLNIFKQKLIK